MTRISINGTAPVNEPADALSYEGHAAAAHVFDHLARAILGGPAQARRAGGAKLLVLNRDAGGADTDSTTNVHLGSNGRVLKVVASGRQGAAKPPGRVGFADDSVRAAVAKLQFADAQWSDASTHADAAALRPASND